MNRMFKGYLFTILSAVIYGLIPVAAKIAYTNGMNSISLIFFRNFLAVPILFTLTKMNKESAKLDSAKDFLKAAVLALLCTSITPLLLFTSYNYIPGGTATTFHFIYPAVTILGGVFLFKQKANLGRFLCVALCSLGIALFYTPGQELNFFGSAVALISGVTYALYILCLDRFKLSNMSRFKLTMYMSIVSSPVLLTAALVTDSFVMPANATAWAISVLLAALGGAAAGVFFQLGTQYVGGERASILSTFEPITSIVLGVLVYQEALTVRSVLGTICVLAATAMIAVLDMRSTAKGE